MEQNEISCERGLLFFFLQPMKTSFDVASTALKQGAANAVGGAARDEWSGQWVHGADIEPPEIDKLLTQCRLSLELGRPNTNKCTLVINIKQMEKSQQQQLLDRAGDVISYSKDNTFLPSLSDRMFRIFDWRWWNMTKWNENKRRGGPFCASVRKRPDGRENNKRRHPTVNNKTRRDKRERDKTHHLVPRTWPVSL